LVEILRQFELADDENYKLNFVEDAKRTFADSSKWAMRQLYVVLCEQILTRSVFKSFESFCNDFLPKLLLFRNEKVANIRVLLARVVTTFLMNNG
jgi:hypothetical protein